MDVMEVKCPYMDAGQFQNYCGATTMLCEERDFKKCRVFLSIQSNGVDENSK